MIMGASNSPIRKSLKRYNGKMERHFQEVDSFIGRWREKNKKSNIISRLVKSLINKTF